MLDLYTPTESKGKLPLVVWIYGGAWRNSWMHDALPSGNAVRVLVGRGYAVASISHRLSQDAVFPAQIEDCKGAIRFLRANAMKYSLDADHIGVWGGSSGGHLAALLGTSGGGKELEGNTGGNLGVSSKVQCVVDFSGPTDLMKLEAGCAGFYKPPRLSPPAQLVGGPTSEHRELAVRANPITYVTKDAPPFLIAHGEKDTLVPINQSEMLLEAIKKAGVEVTFEVIKGGGHGGATPAQEERLLRLVTSFFDKHLKGVEASGPSPQPSSPQAILDKIKNAPANTWIEIPKSALMAVAPKPNQFPKTWAVCGPASVVMAWCGAAFDTKRDRLVIWGGGHADYHGNELYAFDVQKMAWERLTDPFPTPVKDQEVNADGAPNSRHTYGGLAYIAHADRFSGLGGSLAGVGFAKCDRTWTYDFDAKKWEDRQPGGTLPGGGFCLGCAYDPVSKKLFFGSEHKGLFAYDYDENTWAKLDGQPVDGLGFAVDTKRKLLVGVGRGRLVLYDIGQNNFKQQNLKIPGGGDVIHTGNAAGLDYDPVADRMVGWASWAPDKIYALDLDAKKWEVKQADGGPKVTAFARNGVFGRWRYVASVNAFIAVSDANGNVFFYKHTAGWKSPDGVPTPAGIGDNP
ncbi:MAG TPA: alpha/beta hydrolase [Planctomycetota bacterium]|nr:alpha/beta hydrolase [Planctomycetota bacterium]